MFGIKEIFSRGQKPREMRIDLLIQIADGVMSDIPEAEIRSLLESGEGLRFVVKGNLLVLTKGLNASLIEKLGIQESEFSISNGEFRVDNSSQIPTFDYYLDENITEEGKRAQQVAETKIKAYLKTIKLNISK